MNKLIIIIAVLLTALLALLSSRIYIVKPWPICQGAKSLTAEERLITSAINEVLAGQLARSAQTAEMVRYVHKLSDAELTQVAYTNHDEFKKRNPYCCEITKQGPNNFTPSFWQRLTGQFHTFVRVKYVASYVDKKGRQVYSVNETAYIGFDKCGGIWDID
jgi:hypothetical protein